MERMSENYVWDGGGGAFKSFSITEKFKLMWVSFVTILVISLVKEDYFFWIIHMSHNHTSHVFFK